MKQRESISGRTLQKPQTVSGLLSSINPAEMHPQASRKSTRLWACAYCGTHIVSAPVVKGERLICSRCEERSSQLIQRQRRISTFRVAAAVLMTATIVTVVCHHLKDPSTDLAAETSHTKRAFEDFLAKDNFAAAAAECRRASRMDNAAASSLEAELNDRLSGWLASHYGVLSREERDAVAHLLGAYPDTTSSGTLRLKAIRLSDDHLRVEYVGRASESSSSRENARCMLINIFNLLPTAASVELLWISEGSETEELFRATRDQREKLMLESPDGSRS